MKSNLQVWVAVVAIATVTLGAGGMVSAQQAADSSMVAKTTAAEATTARRLLMNSIGGNNDALHDMLDGVLPWNDYVFTSRLQSMFAMFKAFPSTFREEANPWTEEDEAAHPARVSLATSAVWEDWDGFVALNQLAAETTLKAAFLSRADAKPVVDELEQQCESCHEAYRKSFADFKDFEDLPPAAPGK